MELESWKRKNIDEVEGGKNENARIGQHLRKSEASHFSYGSG